MFPVAGKLSLTDASILKNDISEDSFLCQFYDIKDRHCILILQTMALDDTARLIDNSGYLIFYFALDNLLKAL